MKKKNKIKKKYIRQSLESWKNLIKMVHNLLKEMIGMMIPKNNLIQIQKQIINQQINL
jgi:hypothetical protein